MLIKKLIWPEEQIEHIARHGVTPEEVEEVLFNTKGRVALRAASKGSNPVFNVFGQTKAGRFLICMMIQFPDRNGYPITARPMTESEKRNYKKWKKQ